MSNEQTAPAGQTQGKKKKKKPSKARRIITNIFITLAFVVGLGVLLYPSFSNWWNERRNASLIVEYDQVVAQIDDNTYELMMADARAYNDQHKVNVFLDAFGEDEYILHHPYDQLLDPTGNHIMGYIDVPKIGQRLAIGHGTSTETLELGVGHVEGSSLPIGGEGTHSVLAGHRGLPNAKIFTDADQLIKGDKFFLYILDDILAYEIDQIEIVEPDNADLLQIIPGEDLVTLLTCHPYGVNSHRMLIRGHRIPYVEDDVQEQRRERRLPERERPVVIAVIAVICLFLLLIIVRLILAAKDRRKRREEEKRLLREATETAKMAAQEASKAAKAAEEAKDAAIAAREATERKQIDHAVDRAVGASDEAKDAATAAEEYASKAPSAPAGGSAEGDAPSGSDAGQDAPP